MHNHVLPLFENSTADDFSYSDLSYSDESEPEGVLVSSQLSGITDLFLSRSGADGSRK